MGLQRVEHNWVTELNWKLEKRHDIYTYIYVWCIYVNVYIPHKWNIHFYISSIWNTYLEMFTLYFLSQRTALMSSSFQVGFPGGSDGKESACNAEDLGLILRLGRSLGEGNSYPLQYSCLENSMDRWAWWATVQESDMTEWLLLSLFSVLSGIMSVGRHMMSTFSLLMI